jgi:hypothetical protein
MLFLLIFAALTSAAQAQDTTAATDDPCLFRVFTESKAVNFDLPPAPEFRVIGTRNANGLTFNVAASGGTFLTIPAKAADYFDGLLEITTQAGEILYFWGELSPK